MQPITTSFDPYASRYPFLASLTFLAAEEDDTYKGLVDIKGSDWSPIPDGVETHEVAGLGAMQRRGETTPFAYDTPGPAGTKKTYYSNYALAVSFTENLIMDAQYGIIEKVHADLGRAENKAHNLETAGIYDDAFTGAFYTGPDGQPICSTNHTTYMGGAPRSNMLAVDAPFAYQSAQDLITSMRLQKDERGYPNPAIKGNDSIDVILHPNAEWRARELFDNGAALNPTNNHNAVNVLRGRPWNVKLNAWATNSANWFFANPNEKGIKLVIKQKLTADHFRDQYTKGVQYDVRSRWCNHIETWTKIYGSKG